MLQYATLLQSFKQGDDDDDDKYKKGGLSIYDKIIFWLRFKYYDILLGIPIWD